MRVVVAIASVGCGCSGFFDPQLRPADAAPDTHVADAAAPNLVFVTSSMQDGALGGLAGADAICQQRAADAGLPGSYVAFLSTSAVNAISRLAGSRGWVRPDGQPVIDTASDLTNQRAWYPIALDETGHDVRAIVPGAWTGTLFDGTVDDLHDCAEWTDGSNAIEGALGMASATGAVLVDAGADSCDVPHRLYCFGTGGDHPVLPPAPTSGRLAFLSTASFFPGGGLAAADALCNAEAAGAGKSGSFRAALPVTTATTTSRFDLTGAPWVRADGVALTETAADMFAAPFWRVPLAMDIDAQPTPAAAWAGAPDAVSTSAYDCDDWMDQMQEGETGDTPETSSARWSGQSVQCAVGGLSVMCLQQ